MTRLLPGAFCTMMLADLGAEVIKVEEPGVGDYMRSLPPYINGLGANHLLLNRDKKSVTINLKDRIGREIFYKLVSRSNVVVEGFRPGVAKNLGVDYETLAGMNPKLVYCSISGYGQKGKYCELPGHDINYLGLGGLLSATPKFKGLPMLPGVNIADLSGGWASTASILAALLASEKFGRGQYIDVSMLDGVIALMCLHAALYLASGKAPHYENFLLSGAYPYYSVYRTKDGKFVTLGALEEKFWREFCIRMGRDDLVQMHWSLENMDTVRGTLEELFATRSREEWVEFFRDIDTCFGPVYDLEEVFNDSNNLERGTIFEAEHPSGGSMKLIVLPMIFSGFKTGVHKAAPSLGANTSEILSALGYSYQEIERLRSLNVV